MIANRYHQRASTTLVAARPSSPRGALLGALSRPVVLLLALLALAGPARAQDEYATTEKRGAAPLASVSAVDLNLSKLNQAISLRLSEVPLRQALQHVSRQSGIQLIYHEPLVAAIDRKVSVAREDVTVLEALYDVLRGTGLRVHLTPSGRLVIASRTELEDARRQTGSIAGRVTDAATGGPLPGANVVLVGTTQGSSTDIDGRYVIAGIEPGTYNVQASIIGYETQIVENVSVATGELAVVDFTLREASLGLDEVVVVGYVSQRQRDLSGAITTVDAEKLNPIATTSINQMLQGKAPGLNLQTRTAQPGGGVSANIRGAVSPNGNNTPLYIIDGVPVTEYRSSVPGLADGDLGFYGGIDRDPLSYLNPSDIETITVLKDASATAIYGSAAANGVVLITTKGGRAGNIQVNYRGSYTRETPHEYFPLLDAQQFMREQDRLAYERYLFDNQIAPYGTRDPAAVPPYVPLFSQDEIGAAGAGTDWLDMITRSGYVQEHNIALSGGSTNTVAYASFNYQDNHAVLEGSSLARYSGRVNLDQNISEAVRVRLRMSASRLDGNNASTGSNAGGAEKYNMLQAAYSYAPTLDVYDDRGEYTYTFNRLIMSPAAFLTIDDNSRTTTLFATPTLEVDLSDQLTANLVGQVNQESTVRNFYLPRTTNNAQLPEGMAQKGEGSVHNYSTEAYLTYRNRFGAGELTLVGGAGYYKTMQEGFSVQGVGFFTDAFRYNNLGVSSELLQNTIGSYKNARTKLSQFARLNYSLRDRYIVSLVARRDGSSIFSEEHQYGIFPGASVAWILSEEPFLQRVPQLSQLKLRAGYGLAGNESVLSGNTLQLYSPGYPFLIGNTLYNGIALSQVANPYLSWEKVHTFNAGLDFGLWRHRVSGSFDYFVKTARDLLDFNPLPANNAVGRVADNVGSTRSRGFELALHTRNLHGGAFTWDSDLSISNYRSFWVERNPRVPLSPWVDPEGDMDAIYGWETDGLIRSEADIPAHMPDANLGNIRYVDQNGDGVLDQLDVVVIGHGTPRWVLGFNNTWSYKNIDLNVFVYGNLGYQRDNNYAPNVASISQLTNPDNTTVYATDIWSSTNPDGDYPGVATNPYDSQNPTLRNDFNLKEAGFLRLRNVSLGYALPAAWIGGASVRTARVFLNLQDVGVLTNYPGFDPEYTEANPYPKSYSTTIGVEIGF